MTEKPTTPPDLVVDVTLPNGRSGTIEVRAGDNARDLAEKYVKFLDNGAGVLVLTDIVGTTPSNIASSINHNNIKIVAGINLSMILNVFNYPDDSLEQLSKKAIEGGMEGVSAI